MDNILKVGCEKAITGPAARGDMATVEKHIEVLDERTRAVSYTHLDVYKRQIVDAVVPNTWIGKSIMELSVRKKYNVNIVAIKSNNGGKVNISPEPEYKFKDTDIVVLVGDTESINRLESI